MAANDLPVFMDDDLKAWYGISDDDTLEDKLVKLIEKGMDVSELADLVDDPTLKERVLKSEIKASTEVKEGVDINGTPYVSVVESDTNKDTDKLEEKIQKEDTVSSFCFKPTEQKFLPSPSSSNTTSTKTSSSTSSSTSTWYSSSTSSSSSSSNYSYSNGSSSYSQYQKTNEAVLNSSFNLDSRSRLERLRKRAREEKEREEINNEEVVKVKYSRKAKIGFALMSIEKISKKTATCIFIVCAETAVTVLTNSGKVLVERLSQQVADSILKGGVLR